MSELKVEAGKFYRTHSGYKAWIAATECPFANRKPIIGVIQKPSGETISVSWDRNGEWSSLPGGYDLIAPWPDEPEEKVIDGVKYRKSVAWVEVKE